MRQTARSEPITMHEAVNVRFKQMDLAIAEVARKLGATDADLHENWPDLFPEAVSQSAGSLAVDDASAEPMAVIAVPELQTDARLVRDLQASTDRMLLDAPEGWKDAKVAAAELNLEYP